MVQIPVLASVNKLHGRCQLRIAFIGGEEAESEEIPLQ